MGVVEIMVYNTNLTIIPRYSLRLTLRRAQEGPRDAAGHHENHHSAGVWHRYCTPIDV